MTISDADLARHAELPEGIRQFYSPREYAWLSDAQKHDLEQRETEPDTD